MDKKLPAGKGLYVWNIIDMPDMWVDKFQAMGITWIAVKVADGVNSSNVRKMSGGGTVDDILEPFVKAARLGGMQVFGWQYVYGFNPLDEADKAARRTEEFKLDGFIIDAEHQYYGKYAQAHQYSTMLRQLMPDVPIGLSTYRFPVIHPTLPYEEFLDICDFNAPQVYWNEGKSRQELETSYEQYENIKSLPFIPAGRAYYGEGFPKPTPAETVDFLTTAQELGCPAAFFWSADRLWHRFQSLPEIRLAIEKYEWIDDNGNGGSPQPPKTMTLNHLEAQYENTVYETQNTIWLKKKE